MKGIKMISEFTSGHDHKTQITVYYNSGRKFSYTEKSTLPMSVVNFITSDTVVSETTYINDTYWNCINKRTNYKIA